jgi:hypothetical protein
MIDTDVLILLVVGIVLVLGSVIALTSFGGRFPKSILVMMLLSFTAYMSVILVRLDILDLSAWIPGVG